MKKGNKEYKKIVLVTGSSSGLGYELTRQLISKGSYRVIATAREKSIGILKQNFTESQDVLIRQVDLQEEEQFPTLINEICQLWGGVDVVINNAGVCYRSVVEHMDIESEMAQLKTNYLGPMALVRSVLPIMREQKYGRIINISSVSGMVSMPTMASYSASKRALEGASEALWYEARPYGISVTLVEPGFINSESFKRVVLSKKSEMSHRLKGPHSEYYDSMAPFIEKLMKWSFATPDSIARKIIKVLESNTPPLRLPVTLDAQIFSILQKLLPSNLFHLLMFSLLPGTNKWGLSVIERKKKVQAPR